MSKGGRRDAPQKRRPQQNPSGHFPHDPRLAKAVKYAAKQVSGRQYCTDLKKQ